MRGIDTSNWQGDYDLGATGVDFVIAKATEGTGYVDPYCDGTVQKARESGRCWGFYHFAGGGDPTAEADYFIDNCENYFGEGIPVLDWEGEQDVDWVNSFSGRIYERTRVRPWIYANPWRFNQGGVDSDCARWLASYPDVSAPGFDYAEGCDWPDAEGNVVAWQFCSDGMIEGIGGGCDCDLYCGDAESWRRYALGDRETVDSGSDGGGAGDSGGQPCESSTLENEEYVVEIRRK
jgi:lysozyme